MTGTLEQALDDSGETILRVVRVLLLGLTLGSVPPEFASVGVLDEFLKFPEWQAKGGVSTTADLVSASSAEAGIPYTSRAGLGSIP